MPRKVEHGSRHGSRRHGKKRHDPTLPIAATRMAELLGERPTDLRRVEIGSEANRSRPKNSFTRSLVGFTPSIMELMLGRSIEEDDPKFVPIKFSGISQAPFASSEFTKPSATVTRGGILVLSGLVKAKFLPEIGQGSNIRQQEVPQLEPGSFDGPRRLNVAVSQAPENLRTDTLTQALRGLELHITPIGEINGQNISDTTTRAVVQQMWQGQAPGAYTRLPITSYF